MDDIQLLVKIYNGNTLPVIINKKDTLTDILDILNKKVNDTYTSENSFIICKGKILNTNSSIKDIHLKNNDILFLNKKIKGGFSVIGFFQDIVMLIPDIAVAIWSTIEMVEKVVQIFIEVFKFIATIFSPDKLINDIIYGSTAGMLFVFEQIRTMIDPSTYEDVNKEKPGGSGPFGVTNKSKAVCIPPTFMNLLILILCPPLAIILHKGAKGIFPTVICSLLTYFLYYFPGLIYSTLHVFC